MGNLLSGTVTFHFTDIEGSTKLWEQRPEEMKSALAKHDSILREAVESNQGLIVKTTGDGIHAVFEKAIDAVNAAVASQRNLQSLDSALQLKSRMGLHTGEADLRGGDYFGQTLNRAQRIMAAGHGGQILVSEVTAQVAREHLPADVSLLDLGEHHLKGLLRPERIHQLVAPGLQKEFPPLNSIPTATNNLPTQLTTFIGRERELAEASEKLASARLLTLIGPGGTGKTRLSLQIGSEQIAHFRDGVWLAELAPVSDPVFIVPAIASAFEIREVQSIPLVQLVIDYLRAKEILLILDNCEHLVEASAKVAEQLLHACPNLKIIASSREALGIDGETVYRVPSLKDDEATRLFVERAATAEPRFHVTDENASFIAQICSRLDGIPLAIELAAARVKLFTPEEIAQRLDDRFKLLTGGSRTALPRQQTLRALIDWSYTSLNESEQRALRRLAVFSGGWSFEGAEAVLGESEAMESLASLVNKSLVNVEQQESESRYRFPETIRQYAMEKLLESGEAVDARDRHLDYVLQIAKQSEQRMFGSESLEWLDQMEAEHDKLRAALEWASSNHLDKALKLASAIGGFWTVRDHISEARARCNAILEKSETLPDLDGDRARAYVVLGWSSVTIGEHKEGYETAEKAIALAENMDDPVTLVRAYAIRALSSTFLGDHSAAYQAAMKGETLAREKGLKSELAFVLSALAQMEFLFRRDLGKAKAHLDEAVTLAREAGFRWVSSFLAIGMAHTAAALGDLEAARARFTESAEIAKRIGNKRIVYVSQSEMAHVLREHGELDEPLAIYRDLLPKWKDLGHRAAVAHELECIAYILARKEEPERAAALLGAAEAIRKVIDAQMTTMEQVEYEGEVSTLRGMLGEEAFTKNWERGGKLTMEEAMQLAMG